MNKKKEKLKREKDKPNMLAKDLTASPSVSDRPRGQEAVRKQMSISPPHIYKTFHSVTAESTFSCSTGTPIKITQNISPNTTEKKSYEASSQITMKLN